MISTRNLDALPDIPALRRLARSLAMLDAILSPEWEFRYHSFDSHWGEGELMASMRNGQGDDWFALFTHAGVVVIGLDHEAPMFRLGDPWPGLIDALPSELAAAVDEPAFDARNSTFCIWRRTTGTRWERGPVQFPDGDDPDGSAQLLRILDGRPESYRAFAAEYYEADLPLDAVAAVYGHQPLTPELIERLNAAVTMDTLREDVAEIGYPEADMLQHDG
jgi:hypothetical protein